MDHAMGFQKDDSLPLSVLDPQDEIGVETPADEKSDAFASTEIAQEKDFYIG